MNNDNQAALYELNSHMKHLRPLIEGLKLSPNVNQPTVKHLANIIEASVSMLAKELSK